MAATASPATGSPSTTAARRDSGRRRWRSSRITQYPTTSADTTSAAPAPSPVGGRPSSATTATSGSTGANRAAARGSGSTGTWLTWRQLPVGRTSVAAVRSRMHTSCHSDQSSCTALSNRARSSIEVSPRSPWICASPVIPVRIRCRAA
ncbi:hypothetical protein STENM223S_06396 [Streptomyces tendae]